MSDETNNALESQTTGANPQESEAEENQLSMDNVTTVKKGDIVKGRSSKWKTTKR